MLEKKNKKKREILCYKKVSCDKERRKTNVELLIEMLKKQLEELGDEVRLLSA